MRLNWKAVWLTVWFGFLIADQFLNLRAAIVDLVTSTEAASPDVFHRRIQTALLALFILIAVAPLTWTLLRRWFFHPAPAERIEPSRPVEPEPEIAIVRDPRDISAAEAVAYIAEDSAWARTYEGPEEERPAEAARALEQAARDGRVTLRGRRAKSQGYLEPIDRAYWSGAALDLDATLAAEGNGGVTTPTRTGGPRPPVYDHLVVDRESVEKRWPRDNVWRKSGRATVRGMAWSVGLRRKGKNGEEESG